MPFSSLLKNLPHKKAWQLAWPMILSNISVPLMGLADTAMLGHLDSPLYLGAVAVGANLLALFFWMFAFLRMGTTAITGQAFGANDDERVSVQFFQAAAFALLLGLLLLVCSGFLLPIGLTLMAPQDDLRAYALAYSEIRILSAPAVFLTYVIIGWLIGLQNTRIPLLITVFANALNLLLDYLFIVKLGWAHKGAALATLIAEWSGLVFALTLVLLRYRHYFRAYRTVITQITRFQPFAFLSLNAELFVRTTILLLVFNFVVAQSAQQGEIILAVNAIILQLMLFVSFALDGYAHAAESLIAKAIGERNMRSFYQNSIATALPAILISITIAFVFIIFSKHIFSLFSDEVGIQNHGVSFTIWLFLLPLVSVGCYMLDGIFIGAGQTRLMLITMLVSVGLVFFPCWWLLQAFGNHGLWAAFILFNLSRTCLMASAYSFLSFKQRWVSLYDKPTIN